MIPVPPAAQGKSKTPKARNYVFTINFAQRDDGTFPELPRLLDPELWKGKVRYLVYQMEYRTTLHFQGYLECMGQQTMTALHKLAGLERAHFEVRRGSQQEAVAYCKKISDDTFMEGPWEWGEAAQQGKRSDLLEIKDKIDKGQLMVSIAQENFASFIRHGKAFKEYKRITSKARAFKSRVFLFIGPPGKGKSTLMKLIARAVGSYYVQPRPKGSGLYSDDYDGQDVYILDEFDGDMMRPTSFNTLCDEHECVLPVHGGAGHQMVSKFIFIGTNYLPKQWWKKRNPTQLLQTTRRIDVVFKVGFTDQPRWDHSGFQEFGPNINRPHKRARVEEVIAEHVAALPLPPRSQRPMRFLEDALEPVPKDKGELDE